MAEVLKEKNSGEVFQDALLAAASLGPPGLPVVKQAIENPNVQMRRMAIGTLHPEYLKAEEAFPVLFELLMDSGPAIRSSACEAIGKFKGKSAEAAPQLLELFQKDQERYVRVAAWEAIRKLGKADEATTQEWLRLLDNEDEQLSTGAAMALGETGAESKEIDAALVRHLVNRTAAGKVLIDQELEKAIRSGERLSLFTEAARQFEYPDRDSFAVAAMRYMFDHRPNAVGVKRGSQSRLFTDNHLSLITMIARG